MGYLTHCRLGLPLVGWVISPLQARVIVWVISPLQARVMVWVISPQQVRVTTGRVGYLTTAG